jgi:hypothetical protein
MPSINVSLILTTEEYDALKKTQELMKLQGSPYNSVEEYVSAIGQSIVTNAAQNYIKQYSEDTVEGLKNVLSIKEEALAREKAAREALESQLAAVTVQSQESPT